MGIPLRTSCKVIISGNVIEVYQYEKLITYNGTYKDIEKKEIEKGDREEEKNIYSGKRARENIRRLALANFSNTQNAKFLTLTFAYDCKNIDFTNKEFNKFIKRLRYRFGDFKYIAVIEFQDKNREGVIHYHILNNLQYVPYDDLLEIWGHGWIWVNRINHVDNIGAYLVKYMGKKELGGRDRRLKGKKAYFTSRNLKKPVILHGQKAFEILKTLENKKVVFTNSYESEYLGRIIYKEFNLKRGE